MLTPEQRKERRTGVGGSDVAAILGVSQWRTAREVYESKTNDDYAAVENEAMRIGRNMEPVVRAEFIARSGKDVRVPTDLERSPKYPWMIANLDGHVDADSAVLELKTARFYTGWGVEGSDEVPLDYLLQCQHYLIVTQRPLCYVAVLIAGWDFRQYVIKPHADLQAVIIERTERFWKENVVARVPPNPSTLDEIRAAYPKSDRSTATASVEIEQKWNALVAARARLEAEKQTCEKLTSEIMLFMKAASELQSVAGKLLVTWRPQERTYIDTKALRAAHPRASTRFERTAIERKFLVKD